MCVAYVDARQVQDRLDEVCGPGGWQNKYMAMDGSLYCGIGIKFGDEWVWKWDCGTESNIEKQKGQASDAFKRSAVQWGVGRFLYSMDILKLKSAKHTNDKWYPADDNGKIIWGDITHFCETKTKCMSKSARDTYNPPAQKHPEPESQDPPMEWIKPAGAFQTRMFKITKVLASVAGVKEIDMDFEKICRETYKLHKKYPPNQAAVQVVIDELTPRVTEFAIIG
jgi:hypothetical protein